MKVPYRRIMIFGRPGSGKSTFAYALHTATGIPLYHLDKYFYTSNWVERNYAQFMQIQEELVDQDTWIIDGNCTRSFETRWARADLVIYFDIPKHLCYWRVGKRFFSKDPCIDDRAEGCKERLSWKLLTYMWSFDQRVALSVSSLRKAYPATYHRINSDREAQCLLKSLVEEST